MISVAIVEDHQVLIDLLSLILHRETDLVFLGSANTLATARELIHHNPPDVLLLDLGLPDGNGLDLIPDIRKVSPKTQVVILTRFTDESTLIKAINSGISGFVSKGSSLPELLTTIRQAAQGEIVIPTGLLVGLLMHLPRDNKAAYREEKGCEHLTFREREILELLAMGKTSLAIADALNIAPLTVRTHIRNLLSKLGVHSRLEAVVLGVRNGLIKPLS